MCKVLLCSPFSYIPQKRQISWYTSCGRGSTLSDTCNSRLKSLATLISPVTHWELEPDRRASPPTICWIGLVLANNTLCEVGLVVQKAVLNRSENLLADLVVAVNSVSVLTDLTTVFYCKEAMFWFWWCFKITWSVRHDLAKTGKTVVSASITWYAIWPTELHCSSDKEGCEKNRCKFHRSF